jgi:hypothetical protein
MHDPFAANASESSGRNRKPIQSSGYRRFVAFLAACLLLVLHTTGEAFHYRAHLPAGVKSGSYNSPSNGQAAQVKPSTDRSRSIQSRVATVSPRDHCALCSINTLGATLRPDTAEIGCARLTALTTSVSHCPPFAESRFRIRNGSPRGPPARA